MHRQDESTSVETVHTDKLLDTHSEQLNPNSIVFQPETQNLSYSAPHLVDQKQLVQALSPYSQKNVL